MKKPIIGIVSSMEKIPKGCFEKSVHDVNLDYIDMITKNGGIPLIIPYTEKLNDIKRIVNLIDGLVLIGGEDVSVGCYKKSKNNIENRDLFEIEIYKECKKQDKSVLGICRGLQIINVAEKGTLKNIDNSIIAHYIESDGWVNHHEIDIKDNTILKKILKTNKYIISSVHHQQIDKLGKDLIVSSVAKDGVIESIESRGGCFVIAFQGHVEKCLKNFEKYNNVIRYFIKEVANEK